MKTHIIMCYSFRLFKIFIFIKSLSFGNTTNYFWGYKDKKRMNLYTFKDSFQ